MGSDGEEHFGFLRVGRYGERHFRLLGAAPGRTAVSMPGAKEHLYQTVEAHEFWGHWLPKPYSRQSDGC